MNILITHSDSGVVLAERLVKLGFDGELMRSPQNYDELWNNNRVLVFIGALGICVRAISPFLKSKKIDPAVINIDANGRFVQSVISGHIGGANKITKDIAALLGANPIVTTVSDTSDLWALDLLPRQYGWKLKCSGHFTHLMSAFVNGKKTALLLENRDRGTLYLETSLPKFVDVFYSVDEFNATSYELVIAVTPFLHELGNKTIYYRPKVLYVGLGCQQGLPFGQFEKELVANLHNQKLSLDSIALLGTVDIKKEEAAFLQLSKKWDIPLVSFSGEQLSIYKVPNPSLKVQSVTGNLSVAEAAAMHTSKNNLLIEKMKCKAGSKFFTYAVAFNWENERKGFVEFVGAGPGDPELVSVKGKRLLQNADYILYAGSLVSKELTDYAKPNCVVGSSAGMDLNTQIDSMKPFYDRSLFVVRLHTGDPSIYGAIQEQMAVMDKLGWHYGITPGISSFNAAAAALKSQFTIPEEVQTIILTRGEGRTPMPQKEQLHKLAVSQSTMCIYLSAAIAPKVEKQLLTHYPPHTPVAVCHKLTWKDEKIYRCTLNNLAYTIAKYNITMTTLIVVGKAINNRLGNSKLYDKNFEHAFRKSIQNK